LASGKPMTYDNLQVQNPMMNVQQLHTRFLWPFVIGRDDFHGVEKALGTVWRRRELPHLYLDELLEHARKFLSDDRDVKYLTFENQASLFPRGLTVELSEGITAPVRTPTGEAIELFITRDRIGILSITLSPGEDIPASVVLDFNYRLARKTAAQPARLHVMHPAEDAVRWSQIKPEHRSKIHPAPAKDASARDRIGAPGGTFTLAEVVEQLLAPLRARALQAQFSIYAVASFENTDVFDEESCVSWAGPLLSGLTQIEEPTHAGAKAGTVDAPNLLMNRCHWAAVGVLGAAHLIADQPPPERAIDHPFNAERMVRIRDKYFIPYLIGLIQLHVLNKMAEQAVNFVRDPDKLRALRVSLLEFGIGGRFSQLSSRHALHRYYRLVQDGLDVREAWGDLRTALSEIDASNLTMDVAKNVSSMSRLQHAAHTLEYVIISVYAAKLWHMFAGDNKHLHELVLGWLQPLMPANRTLPEDWFVAWGVLLFAGFGFLFAYSNSHRRSD